MRVVRIDREGGFIARSVREVARFARRGIDGFVWSVGAGTGSDVGRVGSSVVVIGTIRCSIETTYSSWLLVAIGTHVIVVLVLARFLNMFLHSFLHSFLPTTRFLTNGDEVVVEVGRGNNTATAELGRFSSVAHGLAVRAFAPKNGSLVVIPVAFAEVEASILGPKEEPDASDDETGGEQPKQS